METATLLAMCPHEPTVVYTVTGPERYEYPCCNSIFCGEQAIAALTAAVEQAPARQALSLRHEPACRPNQVRHVWPQDNRSIWELLGSLFRGWRIL